MCRQDIRNSFGLISACRWKAIDGHSDDLFGQFARKQHSALPPCYSVVLRALRVKCLI